MTQEENKSVVSSGKDAQNPPYTGEESSLQQKPLTAEQIALTKALEEVGEESKEAGKAKKKKRFLIIGLVIAVSIFFWWYIHRNEEETDDSYITGRKVFIAPHVSGYVYELLVNDNQFVHKGDVLIRVDGRDYLAQLHNAQGQLAQAQANFNAAVLNAEVAKKNFPGQLMSAQGEVADAQANLFKAQTDYARQHKVLRAATSQSDIDASTAQLESAEAKMAEAKGHLIQAQPVQEHIKTSQMQVVQGDAQIKSALAAVEKAKLDVGWLTVRAPCDGWISQRSVERGNFVQAGQHILSIVPKEVWVVSNYKETQLKNMRVGQEAEIHVDAYPQLKLKGHVDSFQMGTGESFSTFPPENATGNFVKVVQRVPVKILIDEGLKDDLPLPLGLSLTTVVDVGYTPIDPPKVKAPAHGAADGTLNLETMLKKAFTGEDSAKNTENKNVEKIEKEKVKDSAPSLSPLSSSPFTSKAADKAMDRRLSDVDQGKNPVSGVNQAGDLAETQGKEAITREAREIGQNNSVLPQDLPPAPPPKKSAFSPATPDMVEQTGHALKLPPEAETIKNLALAKMAELGISKEALLDHFEEKEVSSQTKAQDPVQPKDPTTQDALRRMAKEAIEGIKILPISPAKKAEIEKKVRDIAQNNAKAWNISPEDAELVKKAIKQATYGGERKYAIDPELEKELVKAASNRDGQHKTPHTGQAAEDTVAGHANDISPPGSSVNNQQNAHYGDNLNDGKNDFQIPDLKAGNDSGYMANRANDFNPGNVKTEGNALGGNPLGAGIR